MENILSTEDDLQFDEHTKFPITKFSMCPYCTSANILNSTSSISLHTFHCQTCNQSFHIKNIYNELDFVKEFGIYELEQIYNKTFDAKQKEEWLQQANLIAFTSQQHFSSSTKKNIGGEISDYDFLNDTTRKPVHIPAMDVEQVEQHLSSTSQSDE